MAATSARHVQRPAGTVAAALLDLMANEDPKNPLCDEALAATLGVTSQYVGHRRRILRIPPSREREVCADYFYANGLGYCPACLAWHAVPRGEVGVVCPLHGLFCPVAGIRIALRNPSV